MEQIELNLFFMLLRSAVDGKQLTEQEKLLFKEDLLPNLLPLAKKHDVAHLLARGLIINSLAEKDNKTVQWEIIKAGYRYEQLNYELKKICEALEIGQIPFIPLKGAVLCEYYPEPWMRTCGDIDILVRNEDWKKATEYLIDRLGYEKREITPHDISLYSPSGICVELHFDLVEEGRARLANTILEKAWENVSLKDGCSYFYEMSDEFFYFYHVAHMAKHFEVGGCGIRSIIDLWILDRIDSANENKRNDLLNQGQLLKFAESSRKLSRVWFEQVQHDDITIGMQKYILSGGIYGSTENRVAIQQEKRGGRVGYILSRMFIPYKILKIYFPILEKYAWLTPFMQIVRWFKAFGRDRVRRTKTELLANKNIQKSVAEEMNIFLNNIGL